MINPASSATPAQSSPSSALLKGPGGKMGKDEFLKLLVAQMSNQDPLNPMDGSQFAAQLAQFSSVEQLIGMNQKMDEQANAQAAIFEAIQGSTAMGVVGRTVTALGNQVNVTPGGDPSLRFQVEGGGTATVTVMDADGRVVGSAKLGHVSAGTHSVRLASVAQGLPAGTYSYALEVTDSSGAPVHTRTFSTALVDGLRYTERGPVLTAGKMTIPLGSIIEIAAGK